MKSTKKWRQLFFLLLLCLILTGVTSCVGSRQENEGDRFDSVKITYVLNKSSKKIHKQNCGTGTRIREKNKRVYQGDLDRLFEKGYTTCGNCFR